MDDERLDSLIESVLPAAPTEEVARAVTPWRRAMRQIILGIAFTMIGVGQGLLRFALPFAGALLLLLGFRALRRANAYFAACHVLAAAMAALCSLSPASDSVLPMYLPGWLPAALGYSRTAAFAALLILLYPALRRLRRDAGQTPKATAAALLVCAYALTWALAFAGGGGAAAWLTLAAYLASFWLLWRLAREIEEAGYALESAPVRISGPLLALAVTAAVLLAIALGMSFGDKYPMDWQRAEENGAAELRAELTELGFPEDVLSDLTDEELRTMEGAQYVMTRCFDTPKGGYESGSFENLAMTSVAVRLPTEAPSWRVVVHFRWKEAPGFYGTEAFSARLNEGCIGRGFAAQGPYSGRVLYDEGGETFVSGYYSLGRAEDADDLDFFGAAADSLTGLMSFPNRGENQRGYLIYTQYETVPDDANSHIYTQPHYDRVVTPLAYPASEVLDPRRPALMDTDDAYRYVFNDVPPWHLWEYERPEAGGRADA